MSQLHNDFNKDEVASLFMGVYECWACGKGHADCGHHIVGRGNGDSKLETSPLNYAPLNNWFCHLGKSFDDEVTGLFLVKTLRYLAKNKYQLTDKDHRFMNKYRRLYELGIKQLSIELQSYDR